MIDTPAFDWSQLRHAYGPAGDIPALLAAVRVAPAPRDYQDEPWLSLWSALCHQGDVYTASYAAVPELVTLAETRRAEIPVACECLYLAAIIELERGASESLQAPPPMPVALAAPYADACARGAALCDTLRAQATTSEETEMLDICAASFANDLVRARLLADGPPESEGEVPPRAP